MADKRMRIAVGRRRKLPTLGFGSIIKALNISSARRKVTGHAYIVDVHGLSVDCNSNFISLALFRVRQTINFTDMRFALRSVQRARQLSQH
jgi:hypothetical protein